MQPGTNWQSERRPLHCRHTKAGKMTEPYESNPLAAELTIPCPACAKAARFSFALAAVMHTKVTREWFAKQKGFECITVGDGAGLIQHQALYFPELYGDQLAHIQDWPHGHSAGDFAAPKTPYRKRGGRLGTVVCGACGARRRHKLNWPSEAFYQIEHQGRVLWAFNREHAVATRDFIASDERDRSVHAFPLALMKIPAPFLSAKNRKAIVGKLDKLLR